MRTFLYGTTVLMLGCSQWYVARLIDPADGPRFRSLVIEHFRRALDEMNGRCATLFDDVDAFFEGRRGDVPAEDVTIGDHPNLAPLLKQA